VRHVLFVRGVKRLPHNNSSDSSADDASTAVVAVPVEISNCAGLSSSDSSLVSDECVSGEGAGISNVHCTRSRHTWESLNDSGSGCANVSGKSGCTKSLYTRCIHNI